MKRSMFSIAVLGFVLAFLYVPIALAMWWKRRQDVRGRKRLEEQTARQTARMPVSEGRTR